MKNWQKSPNKANNWALYVQQKGMRKMKHLRLVILSTIVILASSCAHEISISPDASDSYKSNKASLSHNVGYYLPPNAKNKIVITPGGGGDRVQYKPYKDIEPAFIEMLNNVFHTVTTLDSKTDKNIAVKNIDYVMSLDITTNSSSPSPFTWPPTWFSVGLDSELVNLKSNEHSNISVKGEGQSEFEFAGDMDIPGKLASRNALLKLQDELLTILENGGNNIVDRTSKSTTKEDDISIRLQKLKKIYDSKLITEDEYKEKKLKLINSL